MNVCVVCVFLSEEEVLSSMVRNMEQENGRWGDFWMDLVAASLMGGVMHTVVAPIERTKLLLQTQESNMAIIGGRTRRFKGIVDCLVRTVREEGVLSLWRGNGTSVMRYYPSVALNFSLKDLYKNMLRNGNHPEGHLLNGPTSNFIAGSAAGCTSVIIIYPLDIAHTRLAADIGNTENRKFRGIYDFLKTVHEKDGVRGIYRGLPASLHGIIIHRGLYFGGFDTMKEILEKSASASILPLWQRWAVAQAVTTSAGLISYPFDTVRRRMMMQSGECITYTSTLDCWRKIYATEGVLSFYRGALSNVFRSTGAAAVLVLYDEIKNFMKMIRR